jgi:A/G-specific adenine glycosylase
MRWYRANGRHGLPWRLTRDPYAVLVSEVMLQQTQVERVLPYYSAWIERWPDFAALASAPASEVIRAWRGLGYNRRALNLHRLAVEVTEHGGVLPGGPKQLLALPGVGEYTASAIRCFAREERVPVADTNIARVVCRVMLGAAAHRDVPDGEMREALAELLPRRAARDHNLALMDLGAMICTARKPACDRCPVAGLCRWRAKGYPAASLSLKPSRRFETTARFVRGRIIDALRESPATTEELTAMLPQQHGPAVAVLLATLEREGMVVRDGGTWRLPG